MANTVETIKSGIYSIKNTVTGQSYIGSSKYIPGRLAHHKHHLRNDKHDNVWLQRSWNKYGEQAFEFNHETYCQDYKELEQLVLDEIFNTGKEYKARFFNINPNADSGPINKKPLTEAHKAKISKALKERYKTHKSKNIGNPSWNAGKFRKVQVTKPCGEVAIYDSAKDAAEALKVHYATIYKYCNGTRKPSKNLSNFNFKFIGE